MGEFFKGWRRKAGLVTLALALLLAVAWMRSYVIRDTVSLNPRLYWHSEVVSRQGGLAWHRYDISPTGPEFAQYDFPMLWYSNDDQIASKSFPSFDDHIEWQWKWLGFDYGAGSTHLIGMRIQVWIIPYWSLVLPLTLLSAWLILIKPRKAKESP